MKLCRLMAHLLFLSPILLTNAASAAPLPSPSSSCEATLSSDLALHIPIINYNNQASYWADFAYVPGSLDFTLLSAGVVSDTQTFNACAPSTLSADLKLHIPTVRVGDSFYWADFIYAHDLLFSLTGAGQNQHSMSDLQGIWDLSSLASGPGAPWWERGPMTIAPDGTFSAETMQSTGVPDNYSGTLSMYADGLIAVLNKQGSSLDSGMDCRMNAGKTVTVCTGTWTGYKSGTTDLAILTKRAASYATADLAGTWEGNSLGSGPCSPWWERSTLTISPDGTFAASTLESTGSTNTMSGTLTISPDGIISLPGYTSFQGTLDAGKTFMVGTATWAGNCAGGAEMKIFTKKAVSYGEADLTGTWEIHSLASGPGAPWWTRGALVINPGGTVAGAYTESSGATDYFSGALTISPDGTIVGQDQPTLMRCSMDSGKTIVVCTDTWTTGSPGTTEISVWTKKSGQ